MKTIYIKSIILIALWLVCGACDKAAGGSSLIAKDPMAVVQVKSLDSLKAVLPQAAQAQAGGIQMMFPDIDTSKEIALVVTSVNPFSCYAAVPYKESMDKLLGASPYKDKSVDKNGTALVPLAGNLPTEFAAYKGGGDSLVSVNVDVALIQKVSGDYLQKKLKEQMDMLAMMTAPGDDEKTANLTKASMDLNVKMINLIFSQTDSVSFSYSKKSKHEISAVMNFVEGSEYAKANAELASLELKTHPEMARHPVFMSASVDYSKAKPIFEPIMKLTDDLYKAMGVNIDAASMMKNFYKIGESDMLMGMTMDLAAGKMDMSSVVVSKNKGEILKSSMDKWLEAISKMDGGELMAFKKTGEQFKGNSVYTMNSMPDTIAPANGSVKTPNMTMSLCSTDKGLIYASDSKGFDKLYGIELKPLGRKGIMMMKIDLSKMAMPGVPPMTNIIEMFFSSEGRTANMTLTF